MREINAHKGGVKVYAARFLCYLGLGLVCSNIPFPVLGFFMGWPSVLLAALWLTFVRVDQRSPSRLAVVAFGLLSICVPTGLTIREYLTSADGPVEMYVFGAVLPLVLLGVFAALTAVSKFTGRRLGSLENTLLFGWALMLLVVVVNALAPGSRIGLWPLGMGLLTLPANVAGALVFAWAAPALDRLLRSPAAASQAVVSS